MPRYEMRSAVNVRRPAFIAVALRSRRTPGGRPWPRRRRRFAVRVVRPATRRAHNRPLRASHQLTARPRGIARDWARHDSCSSRRPESPPTLCPTRTRQRTVPGCRAAVAACLAPIATQVVPLASQVAPLASQLAPLASQLDVVLVQRDVTRSAACCQSPNAVMLSPVQRVSHGVHHASSTMQRDATARTSRRHQGNTLLRTLIHRPANLVTHAANVLTRSANAVTHSANAVTRSVNAVTRSANAVTRSAKAVTRSANAVTRAANAVTRPTNAVTRPANAVTRSANAVTRSANAVTRAVKAMTA